MTARPPIDEAALRSGLQDGYGINVARLDAEPDGADAAAWSCRATDVRGDRWFVKLRVVVRPAAVLVPRHLRALGLDEVVASIPTRSGPPWLEIGSWSVLVSPFVDAPSAMRAGLDDAGWRRLGAFAARLHAVALPSELRGLVPRETFRPVSTDLARTVDNFVGDLDARALDATASAVRDRWLRDRATILHLADRSEALARRVREGSERAPGSPRFVLCHADLHAGNVLVDGGGRLAIVDWDELMLAPPERDLMFVRGSAIATRVRDAQADAFEAGYGSTAADPLLIAWYRIDWAVQDLAGFASEVLRDERRDDVARARAGAFFEGLFAPGDEIDTAILADETLAVD